MKKNNMKISSVIDIGSNEIRLKIAQNVKGKFSLLESLSYPISLGRDTFNNEKISFEKADKVCEILKNYSQVSKEYGCDKIRVIATSAVREANNKDYILDQLRIKTGMNVEVIDNLDEKYYIYRLMLKSLPKEIIQSAMMAYIGSGNLGVSIVENEKIPLIQNIKIGSLRLSELFEDIQDYSREFYLVVEEYVETFTGEISEILTVAPKHFVASGNEIAIISELCNAEEKNGLHYIHKNIFDALYNNIKSKTVDTIMNEYNISNEQAELLLPAMSIFNTLLKFSEADTIIAPVYSQLMDSILFEMLYPEESAKLNKSFYKNTALSSRVYAQKFGCDKEHYKRVEKFAFNIFDRIKKIHGLSSKERILLQAAAILHDCGKIVSIRAHYKNSYNIIRSVDIVGLNVRDLEIVACISYYHSRLVPSLNDSVYMSLSEADRVIVSKLASILRIADALDRSHTQKFDDIEVKLENDLLVISIATEKNIDLEEWAFKEKGMFFEEVFGIKAKLKKKKVNRT